MAEEGHKCCASVSDRHSGWPRYSPCSRKGVIEREGKWYCRQHDPEARKKFQEERDARWRAERAREDEKYRRRAAETRACEGIPTDVLESGLIGRLWAEHAGRANPCNDTREDR